MLPAVTSLRAEERMRAGLWEITMMSDAKAGSIGKTCYTPAIVEFPNRPVGQVCAALFADEEFDTFLGALLDEGKLVKEIAETFGVHVATIYRLAAPK